MLTIKEYQTKEPGHTFHLIIDDKQVAEASTTTFNLPIVELTEITIFEEYRGRGYGRTLVEFIERSIKRLNCTHLKIIASTEACGFYEKLGYTKIYQFSSELALYIKKL